MRVRTRAAAVMVRRTARTARTGELAYYRCYAPEPTTITRLIRVAGRR